MRILKAALVFLRAMLIFKVHLAVENLDLRQQVAILVTANIFGYLRLLRLRTLDIRFSLI